MSDTIEEYEEPSIPSEIDSLKQTADNMNIKYSGNIGIDALKAKIAAKQPVKAAEPVGKGARMVALKREATRLVRIRVANMSPHEKSWKGTWAMAANKAVGTLKKFVPFNVDYHLEHFLFEVIRDKKWREEYEISDGKGGKVKKNRFVPCYTIEVLPDLTPKELQALADDQKKRGSIEED